MGDLGVSKNRAPSSSTSRSSASTSLATRVADKAPNALRTTLNTTLRTVGEVDSVLDKIPLIPYKAPAAPSTTERVAAGGMAVLYTIGAGVSVLPLVGPGFASAVIAAGGALAKWKSPNPEVQNQANLALQTSAYAFGAGLVGLGFIPYARAAIKSAMTAINSGAT